MKARKGAERVIADPSDLSLVSLVTQICSFSAVGTTEMERERDREKESTFGGSGAETNTEAQGVNIRHLQWDFVAAVVNFFLSGGNGVSDLHYAAS